MNNNPLNCGMSAEDLIGWQPPKPSIDINNITEIEKFLFGNVLSDQSHQLPSGVSGNQ